MHSGRCTITTAMTETADTIPCLAVGQDRRRAVGVIAAAAYRMRRSHGQVRFTALF